MKNEDIIKKLSVKEKITLLVLKNNKRNIGDIIELEEVCMKKYSHNMDLLNIYNKGKREMTFELINFFIKDLFKKIESFEREDDFAPTLKLKVIENNDILNAFDDGVSIVFSNTRKKTIEFLEEKCNLSIKNKELMERDEISKSDYINLINDQVILTEDEIDQKVDDVLSFLLPFLKKELDKYGEYVDVKMSFKSKILIISFIVILELFVYMIFSNILILILLLSFDVGLLYFLFFKKIKEEKVEKDSFIEMVDSFDVVIPNEETNKSTIDKELNLKETCEDFYAFLISRGLLVELKYIKELFSAMGCSRLIFIKNKNAKFIEVLNEFLGNKNYYNYIENYYKSEEHVFYSTKNGQTNVSDFVLGVKDAQQSNVNVCSLVNVSTDSCRKYLSTVVKYASTNQGHIKLAVDKIEIPKNMWFIMLTRNFPKTLHKKLLDCSITLDFIIKDVDVKEFNKDYNKITYMNFIQSVKTAREQDYLEDEMWIKIDELESKLKTNYKYSFDNLTIRKLEIFGSIYNCCDSDIDVSIDSGIANILLPRIINSKQLEGVSLKEISTILSDVFDDNLTITKEILNKYKM